MIVLIIPLLILIVTAAIIYTVFKRENSKKDVLDDFD